ncbi:MAG: hypothetical protein ACREHD_05160, partial [Pirellulales bacterium]
LRACGVDEVRAFRAGNYGGDSATLRALARHGIRYDSSYNFCHRVGKFGFHDRATVWQPRQIEGVIEFPVSCFSDLPRHFRHAQLCACSSDELEGALCQAWQSGWYAFVIVAHSFEFLQGRRKAAALPTVDRVVVRRFERICRFLSEHRDKFSTCGFADVDPRAIPLARPFSPIRSRIDRTAWRALEQIRRRVAYALPSLTQRGLPLPGLTPSSPPQTPGSRQNRPIGPSGGPRAEGVWSAAAGQAAGPTRPEE